MMNSKCSEWKVTSNIVGGWVEERETAQAVADQLNSQKEGQAYEL